MTLTAFPDRILQITVSVTRTGVNGGQPLTYVWQQNRMRVTLRQGGAQFGNARVEVFGVPLADMNNIARLWLETLTPQNIDTLAIAVWNGQTFTPLFQGVITWSSVDASGMPQVRLVIEANSSFALSNMAVSPYSNAGPVSLQAALTTIVTPAGYTLNYAASAPQYQLTSVRLTGSPLDQVRGLLHYFPNLTWTTDLQQVIVRAALAPVNSDSVRIAVDTGMQASPVYSSSGLQVNTLFNPQIRPGITLDVETTFDFINRTVWVASVIQHQLDANYPNGEWTTSVAANSYGAKGNNNGASA
jgi:hypothetical protein